MKEKKSLILSNSTIHLIMIGVLLIVLVFYQPILAAIGFLILGYLIFENIRSISKERNDFVKYIEGLTDEFESTTQHAIFNMPFPLVMLDDYGRISWYNTSFLNMMGEEELLEEEISKLIPEIRIENKEEDLKPIDVKFNDKNYMVYPNLIDTSKTESKNNEILMLYWVEDTDFVNLKEDYEDEKLVSIVAYVDNYEDVKANTVEINRPLLLAEIDKNINSYFSRYGGIVRKYENDKYFIVIENSAFKIIEEKKFDILDQMRELELGNTIPITLSIGAAVEGKDPADLYKKSSGAVDVALGRGGDQAVVQHENQLSFYGGKTKAIEKRNKVKARVIGYALRELIDGVDKVFVMGHKNADMDSFGSGIGVLRAVADRGKEGYLVIAGENPSIKNIYEEMREVQPELLDQLLTPEEAIEMADETHLLVVVDNHKPSFTEAPELLDIIPKVVLIDHHRRGAEYIKDPILTYLESYASSTSELVTEVLSYMGNKINLTKFEAEALLAGIMVDTKNFSFQTGVRTFEAASILKRSGADTVTVKQFFRDSHNTFIKKAKVIETSTIVLDRIAIGRLDEEMEDSLLIAAQSANELLNINGVDASFVLTHVDGKIHVSGRSLGNISVQLILEKLGGGGHLTSAGTQLENVDMDEAIDLLEKAVYEFLEEGEEK